MRLEGVLCVVVAAALLLTACASTGPETAAPALTDAEVTAAMEGMRVAYVAAANTGDAAALADLYTDDAVYMPPNTQAVVGKQAVRSALQQQMEMYSQTLSVSIEDRVVAGDRVIGRGSYTMARTPKAGGDTMEDAGKWVSILQRQPDGAWLTAWHIWNSNNPLPTER